MGFSGYFQAIIRDQVSARVSASPLLALLRPVAPNILLRIGRDELSGLVRASVVRDLGEVLLHRDTLPRRKADRPQRVIRAKVQRHHRSGTRALIHHRAEVVDHVRGMHRVARGASIAEAHAIVDIDELRPREPPTLVFEEYRHPVQCHGERQGVERGRGGKMWVYGWPRISCYIYTPHDAPGAIPGEFDEELTLGPKEQE